MIDYDEDKFTEFFNIDLDWDDQPMPCINDLVEDYIRYADQLNYPTVESVEENKYGGLNAQRKHLCEMLMQKVEEVRGLTDDEADWTLDIVGSGS